jgi:hypothetical protein
MGIYAARDYEFLTAGTDAKPLSPEKIVEAVGSWQQHPDQLGGLKSEFAKKGGVNREKVRVQISENPWQFDDAEWFKMRPDRSHRLRAVYPGELEAFGKTHSEAEIPAGYEWQVLVRQIEPGKRMRWPFCHNIPDIPDIEPLLHALFDYIQKTRIEDLCILTPQQIAKLAQPYINKSEPH